MFVSNYLAIYFVLSALGKTIIFDRRIMLEYLFALYFEDQCSLDQFDSTLDFRSESSEI